MAISVSLIIDQAISHFRQADAGFGARLEAAVKAVRTRINGEDVTVQIGGPART